MKKVKTPEVFQIEASECGAASLLMILRYYGCFVSMEDVRRACGVSRNGCDAAGIVLAARAYGLKCSGYRCDTEKLKNAPLPSIIHWSGNHFVVLEGFKKNSVLINDPALGRRSVSLKEFEEEYTGIVLVMKPGEGFNKIRPGNPIKDDMTASLNQYKNTWIFLFLVNLVSVIPGMILPVLTGYFMDEVVIASASGWLIPFIYAMSAIILSRTALEYMRAGVLSRLKNLQILKADHDLIRKLFRLPLPFYEQRYAGELSQREEAVGQIYEFIDGNLAEIFFSLIEALFFLALMIVYSPRLSVIGVTGAALGVVILNISMKMLSGLSIKQRQDDNRMMGILCSGLSVFGTIKAGGLENDYLGVLMDQYAEKANSSVKLSKTSRFLDALPQTIFQLINVSVLMSGCAMAIKGTITAGCLVAFCQILGSFLSPVSRLILVEKQLQTLKASVEIVEDIYETAEDTVFTGDDSENKEICVQGYMEAKGLSFGYMKEQPVVRNLNVSLFPGKTLGIVGPSGCGKSTAAKLLSGLIVPWEGKVLLDGVPVHEVAVGSRLAGISLVSQKEAFFSASVRDNLTLFNQEVSEQTIFRALFDARALGMVNSLPSGMDFKLDEGGKNLSGGQLQQLAIARALINDPAILILDEATSAMDPERERDIMENLRKRGCACIVIAHRLSAVKGCDEILVMDEGRVTEKGNHAELIRGNGLYSRIYRTEDV